MFFFSWLEQLFSSGHDVEGERLDTGLSFAWSQNNRVIIAILIVIVSAFCMWWIVS